MVTEIFHHSLFQVPDELNMKMSREGSRIGTHDQYYSDEQLEYVDLSTIPNYPHACTSPPGRLYDQTDISELPELSPESACRHQSIVERAGLEAAATDFDNRCSLYDSENGEDTTYINDLLENETGSDITTVTRPLNTRPYGMAYPIQRSQSQSDASEGSEVSDQDGYTETSLCSDEEYDDDQPEDPLDPENTRKLERDIKRLLKDLQKRTEEV